MARFTLLGGNTFSANHFGMTPLGGSDGVIPTVLQTYPDTSSSIHSDYLVDDVLWGSIQTIDTFVPPFFRYGDPLQGDGWSGSGIFDLSMSTSLLLYDRASAASATRKFLGTVTGVTFDYRLLEDYARRGDPDSGMWTEEWFHRVTNLSLSLAMFAGDDTVILHDGNDFFVDPAGMLSIRLGGGNDTLFAFDEPGMIGGDTVHGDGGDDTIIYQGNFGRFYGGDGNDTIGFDGGSEIGGHRFYGGSGNDSIEAVGTNSTIYEQEGSGNDHYIGGGSVILNYSLGTTALVLDLGLSFATGEANHTGVYGIDTITGIRRVVGSQGNDQLTGYDALGSEISGHNGSDIIIGGLADDTLRGGEGNDRLIGLAGSDRLNGGNGADRFVFNATTDSQRGSTRDIIEDFTGAGVSSGDIIVLRDIDANELLAGNQTFTFIGAAAFTALGQLQALQTTAGVIIRANTADGLAAEFEILVRGTHNFAAGDFVL